jgi:hypothetical protein
MHTIVELPEFIRKSQGLFADEERRSLINYLATHPQAGDLIQGTGGIRKLRWAIQGRGKSGGARVIYYFHNESIPLFLLTALGKNEKANISPAERNDLAKLTNLLRKHCEANHE